MTGLPFDTGWGDWTCNTWSGDSSSSLKYNIADAAPIFVRSMDGIRRPAPAVQVRPLVRGTDRVCADHPDAILAWAMGRALGLAPPIGEG